MRAHANDKTPRAAASRKAADRAASLASMPAAPRLGGMSGSSLLALQRSAGNAAVTRILEQAQHGHSSTYGHRPVPQAPAVQRSAVDEVLRTPGTPLAEPIRRDMEARIGADFSDVRLHTGTAALRSAREIGARAYTSGNHVVIGDGGADRHTLAHELTHVVQQRRGPVAGTDNGHGLKVSSPSDPFEREAEANATRVLSGPAPEQSSAEETPASQHGRPAVQRALDFARGAWSRQNLAPDRFAVLLEKASEESEGIHFSVPYRALFKALEDSRISIEIDEETDFRGARAMFVLDSTTAEGGVLRIKPPAAGASARELREFAATVTHEMQHAFDSVSGGFKAQTPKQTVKQRKISSELRAFGVEAAAAFKLAIGDSYPQSAGKPSAILARIQESRLSSERKQLALEYHVMDGYVRSGADPLAAFGKAIPVGDSTLLNRLAGYMRAYEVLTGGVPDREIALAWLRETPAVVQKGLVEGIHLFHNNRPQVDRSS